MSSVYDVVDLAVVGKYHGQEGNVAISIVSPFWNVIYSLGLLVGIGDPVLFSTLRGQSKENEKKSNEYFSTAAIGAVAIWFAMPITELIVALYVVKKMVQYTGLLEDKKTEAS